MTGKEIVRRSLEFKEIPRAPAAILDGAAWMLKRENVSYHEIFNSADQGVGMLRRMYDEIDTDMVWPASGSYNLSVRALGAKVDFSQKGCAPEIVKPLFDNADDVKAMSGKTVADLKEILTEDGDLRAMLKETEEIAKLYGDTRLVILDNGGPFTMAAQMIGMSEFMMLMFMDPDAAKRLIGFSLKLNLAYDTLFLEAGAQAVQFGEPACSADLISPEMFERFALPVFEELCAELPEEPPKILHICGNSEDRIGVLKGIGIDGFSLDCVPIKRAMELAAGDFAIIGNLSPFAVMLEKSAEDVYAIALETAREGGLNGGYILEPGCDLPPDTPLENIRAMIQAAHDHRREDCK